MIKGIIACSHCFHDMGLRKEAEKIGIKNRSACPMCGSLKGMKLDRQKLEDACFNYFHIGSTIKATFGSANYLEINDFKNSCEIECLSPLKKDIKFLADNYNINVFYYGPQLWRLGSNNWIEELNSKSLKKRNLAIDKVAKRCYVTLLDKNKHFYRIRTNLKTGVITPTTYDAPPVQKLGEGRMNIKNTPVFYAAFNVETCIHESRLTIDDEIFVATLHPTRELRFLDFCRIKKTKNEPTPFDDLGVAITQIFLAGSQSYCVTQAFSKYAYENGFDGVIYPSYFNSIRDKCFRNIVIFGRQIAENNVKVTSIDRITLNSVKYGFTFGPATDNI